MKTTLRTFVIVLIMLFATLPMAFGQGVSGQISGTVTDPDGAVIIGATVQLTNEVSQQTRETTTDARGAFIFTNLLPNTFTVRVSSTGFNTYQQTGIELSATERRGLPPIRLEIGSVATEVSVTAEMIRLQTESSERVGTIERTQIEDVPLILDRMGNNSYLEVLKLMPGTVGNQVNGGASGQLIVTLDGITSSDTGTQGTGGQVLSPNPDTIAEVKVTLSNYQAEYGVRAGGTVTVVTRAGNREFHGSGYYYQRHEALNAMNFFDNLRGRDKPLYQYKNPGYTIGGPVLIPGTSFNSSRNKVFFFWSQEWLFRTLPSSTSEQRMPTAAEIDGDFSTTVDSNGTPVVIWDPTMGSEVPFPENKIDPSRINTSLQNLLKIFPEPNIPGFANNPNQLDPTFRYNFQETYTADRPRNQNLLRLDWNISPNTLLYGRYLNDFEGNKSIVGPFTGQNGWPQVGSDYRVPGHGVVVTWIQTFAPNVINEFTGGFNTTDQTAHYFQDDLARMTRAANGVDLAQLFPSQNPENLVPEASFGGGYANISWDDRFPWTARNTLLNFSNNLSWIKGAHNMKFGFYMESTVRNSPKERIFTGDFEFSPAGQQNMLMDSNNGLANALLGNFQTYQESDNRIDNRARYKDVEFFAQDNWQVTQRLTIDVGARFQWIQPTWSKGNKLGNFEFSNYDPSDVPSIVYYSCLNGEYPCEGDNRKPWDPVAQQVRTSNYLGTLVPGSASSFYPGVVIYDEHFQKTPPIAIAPRIGFAYDVFGNGKTAIRGGWGMFYDRTGGDDIVTFQLLVPPIINTPTYYYSDVDTLFGGGTEALYTPQVGRGSEYDFNLPGSMNWSFGIQQDVGFNTVLDVAYVGTVGRHLRQVQDWNYLPYGSLREQWACDPTHPSYQYGPVRALGQTDSCLLLPTDLLRGVPGWGSINIASFDNSSNYHSMQVQVNRRMSRNFQIGGNYTWSKTLTYAIGSGRGGGDVILALPARYQYGLGGGDRPHNVNLNFVYNVPEPSVSNPVVRHTLGGWQISGYAAFVSGAPQAVGFSQYISGTRGARVDFAAAVIGGGFFSGSGAQVRPDLVGDPVLDPTFRRQAKVNVDAFAPPSIASNGLGNAPRTQVRGPGTNNWDISIAKTFPLGAETRQLEFRWEMFNAFNHTQFSGGNFNAQYDSSGNLLNSYLQGGEFGLYTGARDARIMVLSGRVRF